MHNTSMLNAISLFIGVTDNKMKIVNFREAVTEEHQKMKIVSYKNIFRLSVGKMYINIKVKNMLQLTGKNTYIFIKYKYIYLSNTIISINFNK